MKSKTVCRLPILIATCVVLLCGYPVATQASGIFTLRGKLKGFTETTYTIATKSIVYEIKKSELTRAQLDELKSKKPGKKSILSSAPTPSSTPAM